MTSSDRFPVPVRSAVKSCCQNLSKRALNALTVQASTTELGKLFQIFTMRAEKNAFVSHNEKYDFAIYSGCLALSLRGRSASGSLRCNSKHTVYTTNGFIISHSNVGTCESAVCVRIEYESNRE